MLTQEFVEDTIVISAAFIENKLQNLNLEDAKKAIHNEYADKTWVYKVAILLGLLQKKKQDWFSIFFDVFLTNIISADFTIEKLNISIEDGQDQGKSLLFMLLDYKFEDQYNRLLNVISTKVTSKRELNQTKICGDLTYLAALALLDKQEKFFDLYEALLKEGVPLYDIYKSVYVNSDKGPTLLYSLAMDNKRDLYKKLYSDLHACNISAQECNKFSMNQEQYAAQDHPSVIFHLAYHGNAEEFTELYNELIGDYCTSKDINFPNKQLSCLYQIAYNNDMENYDMLWGDLCALSVSARELNVGETDKTSLFAALVEGGHIVQFTNLYDKLLAEGVSAKEINKACCFYDNNEVKSILLLLTENENWDFASRYISKLIDEKVSCAEFIHNSNEDQIISKLLLEQQLDIFYLLIDAGFFEKKDDTSYYLNDFLCVMESDVNICKFISTQQHLDSLFKEREGNIKPDIYVINESMKLDLFFHALEQNLNIDSLLKCMPENRLFKALVSYQDEVNINAKYEDIIPNTQIITELSEIICEFILDKFSIHNFNHDQINKLIWKNKNFSMFLCDLLESVIPHNTYFISLYEYLEKNINIMQLHELLYKVKHKTFLPTLIEYKYFDIYDRLFINMDEIIYAQFLDDKQDKSFFSLMQYLLNLDDESRAVAYYNKLRIKVQAHDINNKFCLDNGPTLLYYLADKAKSKISSLFEKLYDDLIKEQPTPRIFSLYSPLNHVNKLSIFDLLARKKFYYLFNKIYSDLNTHGDSKDVINAVFTSKYRIGILCDFALNNNGIFDMLYTDLSEGGMPANEINVSFSSGHSVLGILAYNKNIIVFKKLYTRLIAEGSKIADINKPIFLENKTTKNILSMLCHAEDWDMFRIYVERLIEENVKDEENLDYILTHLLLKNKNAELDLMCKMCDFKKSGFIRHLHIDSLKKNVDKIDLTKILYSEDDIKLLEDSKILEYLNDNKILELAFEAKKNSLNHDKLLLSRGNRAILRALLECENIEIANEIINSPSIPENYQDIITKCLILYPVTISSGHTYDKYSILEWINQLITDETNPNRKPTCCYTKKSIEPDEIRVINQSLPNVIIQESIVKIIEDLRQKLSCDNIDNFSTYANASSSKEENQEIKSKQGTTLKRRLTM